MKKKETKFVPQIDFKEQTPEVLVEQKKPDSLYEKAFLSREEIISTEFSQNTAVWD